MPEFRVHLKKEIVVSVEAEDEMEAREMIVNGSAEFASDLAQSWDKTDAIIVGVDWDSQ